ncbi:NACHT domain-containing protein [Streptomyces sp. NPDC059479]|uniref:NACHT domain-containing protein n=1 Tax=Streptomyces sp. NPDC059479 TaxID=3346848 RepID=UPI0036BACA62
MDVHRRIPSRRLVVLGRAGSGKTILTIRFVLDLLAAPADPADPTAPVPVIFSLVSWNPTTTTLRRWLTGQLERDHPRLAEKRDRAGLAETGPGTSTRAAALVDNDRILPVLDGFDEIADGLHRPALKALNDTDMPLLLTSRLTEYAAAVEGTQALTSAAAVELADLSLTDLDHYLPRATRKATPTGTAWDPVLKHLREHPQDPAGVRLATVLNTPLMVGLARTIYGDTPDRDSSTLLDTGRFSTPEALEDHLLDEFIPTVYRDRPLAHRERVPHWLGYLAQHLDRLGTRDLAWWQLGDTMRRSSRMCVIGLVAGLVFGLVGGCGFGFTAPFADTLVLELAEWPRYGLMTLLTHGVEAGLHGGLPYGVASGVAFALTAAVEAPIDLDTAVGPPDLLRTNRATVLFQLLVLALSIGIAGGILYWIEEFRIIDWILFGAVGGLGGALAYGLSLTPWGQWVTFSRIWLPLTGRLPWTVSAFLEDAHRRGVLRQAGAVYQFRHARLQDHLTHACRTPSETRTRD